MRPKSTRSPHTPKRRRHRKEPASTQVGENDKSPDGPIIDNQNTTDAIKMTTITSNENDAMADAQILPNNQLDVSSNKLDTLMECINALPTREDMISITKSLAIKEDLNELRKDVNIHGNHITSIYQQLETSGKRVDKIGNNFNRLDESIKGLKNELEALRTEVAQLKRRQEEDMTRT